MAGHEHFYGICENKCMVEVSPKSEVDQLKNATVYREQKRKIGTWYYDGEDDYDINRVAFSLPVNQCTVSSDIYTINKEMPSDFGDLINISISVHSEYKYYKANECEIDTTNDTIRFKKPALCNGTLSGFVLVVIEYREED